MPVQKWSAMMNDASKVESKKFVPLDPGTYSFVIKDQPKIAEKTNKNNEPYTQIGAKCTVESGPRANGTIFNNFNVNSANATQLKIFFEQLAVLGLGEDFFATEPTMEQVAAALVGRRFVAEVYKNGDFMNMKNFMPPTGPAPTAGVPTPTATPAPAPTPTPQAQPAPQAAPAAPAPAPQAQPAPQAAPAQPQAPAAPENPWGAQPQAVQAQAPAGDNPWGNQAPPMPPPTS